MPNESLYTEDMTARKVVNEIENEIDDAVQKVYYKFLVAFKRSGDDMDVNKDYRDAISTLRKVLVYMILNNPKED